MYYATFKEGDGDVAEFETREQRDNWVAFKDDFSVTFECNADNAPFQRKAISAREAKELIETKWHKEKDLYDGDITWYF